MMRKSTKLFVFTAFSAIIALTVSGCAGLFYRVNIRTENNLSSVIAGGSLKFSSSGRDIEWSVSSAGDGTGSVTSGTFISSNGLLSVSSRESLSLLYVTAVSSRDGFSDTRQIRVVTVTGVTVNPVNQTVSIGRNAQFRAQVSGSNNPDHAVRWRVSSDSTGSGFVSPGTSINYDGTLSVSLNETNRTLYVIASSVVDQRISGSAPVNIVVPVVTSVSVSPANQTVRAGSSLPFNAQVSGTYDPVNTVTWKVSSNASGTGAVTPGTTVSSRGVLTVANDESLTVLYIIATSTYDPNKSGSVAVSVVRPVVNSVIVSPLNQTVSAGGVIQFQAQVTGTNNPSSSVTWKVSSNAAGTGAVMPGTRISSNGVLTVSDDETSTRLYVFAASVFDPSKSGSVIVTVNVPAVSASGGGRPNRPPASAPPAVTPLPAPTPPVTASPPAAAPPAAVPVVTGVTVSPSSHSMKTNETRQFSASVTGTNNPASSVTWRVTPNADGSAGNMAPNTAISSGGLLKVAPNEWAVRLYVFAASTADPAKFAMAVVTITNNNANQGSNQGQGN